MPDGVLDRCQWCGTDLEELRPGLVECRHCDRGHPRNPCVTCDHLTDAKVVFDLRGEAGGLPPG